MLKVSITSTNNIAKATKKIQKELNKVPQEAIQKFIDLTPVRSGNAQRNTKLQGNTIEANYPYATVLDKGRHMTQKGMRGSSQAPKGMTIPFVKWMKQRIKKIFGK